MGAYLIASSVSFQITDVQNGDRQRRARAYSSQMTRGSPGSGQARGVVCARWLYLLSARVREVGVLRWTAGVKTVATGDGREVRAGVSPPLSANPHAHRTIT